MKKMMRVVLGALCVVLGAGAAFAGRLSSDPRLVPDYNRDGVINTLDYDREAAGEPFIIWLNDDDDAEGTGDGSAAISVRTIPGLKYSLVRGAELGAIIMTVVEPTLATEAQMTLTDAEPPTDKAFYRIDVSVP